MEHTDELSQPARKWMTWAVVLVLLYIGFSIAGWERSLGYNEVWALYIAGQPLQEQFKEIRADLVHPPLIYLAQRAWIHLFGQTDASAKILVIAINIPAIVLFTLLASRITRHWRVTSFLFACIYFKISTPPTQVRMYGLVLLWGVVGMLIWDRWRKDPRTSTLLAWMASMVLLIYSHYFAVLFITAFVAINWVYGKRPLAFTAAAAGIGAAFLPWFLYVLPVYRHQGLAPNLGWVNKEPHLAVAEVPTAFIGPTIAMTAQQRAMWVAALWTVIGLLVFLAIRNGRRFWQPLGKQDTATRWLWISALLSMIPVTVLYLFAAVVIPSFNARFIMGILPGFWIFMVLLSDFGGRWGRMVLYGALLPVAIVSVVLTVPGNASPSPVRKGTLQLAHELGNNDLVLCDEEIAAVVYWEWTRRLGQSGHLNVLLSDAKEAWASAMPQKPLNTLDLSNVNRVWLFHDNGKRMGRLVKALKERGFAPIQAATPRDSAVSLLGRAPAPVSASSAPARFDPETGVAR